MQRHPKNPGERPRPRRLNDNGEGISLLTQGENALFVFRALVDRMGRIDELSMSREGIDTILTAIDYVDFGSREQAPWTP